jgi:hypothetical protein
MRNVIYLYMLCDALADSRDRCIGRHSERSAAHDQEVLNG